MSTFDYYRGKTRFAANMLVATAILADDVKIRWLMALASLSWAWDLAVNPTTIDRPYYELMRVLPAWFWAFGFAVHGVGAIWIIWTDYVYRFRAKPAARLEQRHDYVALWINGWGVAIWLTSTMMQNIAQQRFVVSTSLEFLACMFLFCTFVVTGWFAKHPAP